MTSGGLLSMRLCSYREAARTLRMPPSTLWQWLEGRETEGHEPILRTTATGDNVMTWGEFVEAAYMREYRRRRVPLGRLRLFIEALRDELQLPHPLATKRPFIAAEPASARTRRTCRACGEFRPVVVDPTDGQLVLSYPAAFLDKVEFAEVGDMPAVRWFPAGKQSSVVVDPEVSGGAPTVLGIRTEALDELASDGLSVAALAEDYGLSEDELRQALAYGVGHEPSPGRVGHWRSIRFDLFAQLWRRCLDGLWWVSASVSDREELRTARIAGQASTRCTNAPPEPHNA